MAPLPVVEASRLGERGESAARFAAAWRRAAWLGAAALTWAAGLVLAWALPAAVGPFQLLAIAGLAAGAGLLLALARFSRPAAAPLALALALAVAGHARGPLAWTTGAIVPPSPTPLVLALAVLGVLAAPLLAGWRAHAVALGLVTTGRLPRGLPLRALDAVRGADLLAPAPAPWRGLLRRYADGLLLPGALALDLAGRMLRRARRAEVVHGALDADLAKAALVGAGFLVESDGRRLILTLDERHGGGGRVSLRSVPLALSPQGGVEVRGSAEARRVVRRALESEAAGALAMCWTEAGRRLEARLDAMLREAAVASSLEERSALYEEAQRVERVLEARELLHDDWVALRAWKAHRLRAMLAHKLLGEPVGPRTEGRVLAPAPALRPDLATLLDAGGLSTLARLVFVPHWIVPVRTGWGEVEVLVNALTGKPHPRGAQLLDAARAQGVGLMLDAPRSVRFLPSGEPTAAILRDLREALGPGVDVSAAASAPAEWLLVPHAPGAEGYVDAVTGAGAPDMGPVAAVAAQA